jgi:hypothetical protein
MIGKTKLRTAARPARPTSTRLAVARLLVALLVLPLPRPARGYEYELEGTVTAVEYMVRQTNILGSIQFHVYVKDCGWLIRATPEATSPAGQRVSYWEFGSDGHSCYRLLSYRPNVTKDPWLADVHDGAVLQFTPAPQIAVVWLATASPCYLDDAGSELLPPYSRGLSPIPVHALVARLAGNPHLPEQICFLSDGYARTFGQAVKYPLPYGNGFTSAVFHAVSFTNTAALRLPTQFSYEAFERRGAALATIFTCQGTVAVVRSRCSLESFLPKMPPDREILVKDFRFQSPGHLQSHEFAYRSSTWLTPGQVRHLAGFTNYLAWEKEVKGIPRLSKGAGPAAAPPSRFPRSIAAACIVLSTLLMLLLLRLAPRNNAT